MSFFHPRKLKESLGFHSGIHVRNKHNWCSDIEAFASRLWGKVTRSSGVSTHVNVTPDMYMPFQMEQQHQVDHPGGSRRLPNVKHLASQAVNKVKKPSKALVRDGVMIHENVNSSMYLPFRVARVHEQDGVDGLYDPINSRRRDARFDLRLSDIQRGSVRVSTESQMTTGMFFGHPDGQSQRCQCCIHEDVDPFITSSHSHLRDALHYSLETGRQFPAIPFASTSSPPIHAPPRAQVKTANSSPANLQQDLYSFQAKHIRTKSVDEKGSPSCHYAPVLRVGRKRPTIVLSQVHQPASLVGSLLESETSWVSGRSPLSPISSHGSVVRRPINDSPPADWEDCLSYYSTSDGGVRIDQLVGLNEQFRALEIDGESEVSLDLAVPSPLSSQPGRSFTPLGSPPLFQLFEEQGPLFDGVLAASHPSVDEPSADEIGSINDGDGDFDGGVPLIEEISFVDDPQPPQSGLAMLNALANDQGEIKAARVEVVRQLGRMKHANVSLTPARRIMEYIDAVQDRNQRAMDFDLGALHALFEQLEQLYRHTAALTTKVMEQRSLEEELDMFGQSTATVLEELSDRIVQLENQAIGQEALLGQINVITQRATISSDLVQRVDALEAELREVKAELREVKQAEKRHSIVGSRKDLLPAPTPLEYCTPRRGASSNGTDLRRKVLGETSGNSLRGKVETPSPLANRQTAEFSSGTRDAWKALRADLTAPKIDFGAGQGRRIGVTVLHASDSVRKMQCVRNEDGEAQERTVQWMEEEAFGLEVGEAGKAWDEDVL